MQKTTKLSVKTLVMGAICIATSFVLSYIKLYSFPQGGSITLFSMLPLMLFAYLYGLGPGLLAGVGYSILQIIQGVYYLGFVQFLLDYPIAFTALGLAGLFYRADISDAVKLPLSVALAGLARTTSSFLSGWLFFAEYAPAGQSPMLYSLITNLTVIGLDTLICVIGAEALLFSGLIRHARKML